MLIVKKYLCVKCKKTYYKKGLIIPVKRSFKVQVIEGICPECESRKEVKNDDNRKLLLLP